MKKTKSKFYTEASKLLKTQAPTETLYELGQDFDISKDEITSYIGRLAKSKQISSAVMASKPEKELIYACLDQKFADENENIVTYQRGENTEFYEYKNGVYEIIGEKDMYDKVDSIFKQYALFDYRTSTRKVKDTITRVSATLSQTPQRHFSDKQKQPYYLNFKNGLYDISENKLKEHSREFFTTVQIPFVFDTEAICPKFLTYIDEITQTDEETKQMVQDMFGYCLFDGNPKHKVFYLYGTTARNGKSSLAKIVCGLLGENNVSELSLEQIANKDFSGFSHLVDKQINFSDEVDGKYIESSTLTNLSAEGIVTINPKYKIPYTAIIKAKFIISCNDLPRFQSAQGMKHRMIAIPFNYQIPENKRIERIDQKLLKEEGAGILNWAIEGMTQLKERGNFVISKLSEEETFDNALTNFPVLAFLTDVFDFDVSYNTPFTLEELYGWESREVSMVNRTGYRLYCFEANVRLCSRKTFANELKRFEKETHKIIQTRDSQKRFYVGLKKKEDDDF